jgi:hypothetical protein
MRYYVMGLLVIALTVLTGSLFVSDFNQATARQSHPETLTVPREVVEEVLIPLPLRQAFAEAVGRDDNSYHITAVGETFHATNEEHDLDMVFEQSMIDVSVDGGTWQLFSDVPAHDISVERNRLTYHRDGYDEWYINSPLGLQQGFTLYEPSEIIFRTDGTLMATASSQTLHIGDQLMFTGLMAYDANHKSVHASFEISGNHLAYLYNDVDALYPLTIDPWLQQAYLTGTNPIQSEFGDAVAIDGMTAAIGAPELKCPHDDAGCGGVYIFVRDSGVWTEQAILLPVDAVFETFFGLSVDLDGDNLIAGAANLDTEQGGAYVFTRSGTVWTEQQRLIPSENVIAADYGQSVAIDGDIAAVGASASNSACQGCGAVYVFTRNGSTWTEQDILTASDANSLEQSSFGVSIALDNSEILVGAPQDNQAYFFDTDGTTWTERKKLFPFSGRFGMEVDLDNGTAIILARDTGKVYVYTGSGNSWLQETILTNPDMAFVGSAAVSGDLVILGSGSGDCVPSGTLCGRAYVYSRVDGWTTPAILSSNELESGDNFGSSVDISGNLAIVAANGDLCTGIGGTCGGVFIFETAIPTDTPTPDPTLILTANAACVDADLAVTITQGEGPFNITASAGQNTPVIGVGVGTTTIIGPEKWDNLTVTETTGDAESLNLGQFKCRTDERPTPLTPAHRERTTNVFPMFSWTAITYASNYRVFIFDNKVVAERTVDIRQNSGGPTQVTLAQNLPVKRLFWRVRGRTNRVWGLWSVRFTLFIDPPPVREISNPLPTIDLNPTVMPIPPGVKPTVVTAPNSR